MRRYQSMSRRFRAAGVTIVGAAALLGTFGHRGSGSEAQHNPGRPCASCHGDYQMGATIFTDRAASQGAAGVPFSLVSDSGGEIPLGLSNPGGNIAVREVPTGRFLIRAGKLMSRTWHVLPGQGDCNACHSPSGNAVAGRDTLLPDMHTRIPEDNGCTHCHHFPAGRSYAELAAPGVLAVSPPPPPLPPSQVEILGRIYPFDPSARAIDSVRPDIFAPGYFSMFDAILAVARANGIAVDYHYDESRKTHFIDRIDGVAGDYWYHFSFDAGSGNAGEIKFRRANRWDELLWRPGAWVRVVAGEDLPEIKQEYLEEIERERAEGNTIPLVRISVDPSDYRGNPPGSGRGRVQREFRNVRVAAHDMRAAGSATPYAKPFRPGVVTALDVLLSLRDQGMLDAVTSVHYSYFAQRYIDSRYVVALGFPGIGTMHASGRQGFVYVTENGSAERLPNNADGKLHVTSDILVIHAPDFATWRWAELGQPYYEAQEPEGGLPGRRFQVPLPTETRALQTGVAVVNPGAGDAEAVWTVYDDAGSRMPAAEGSGRVVLQARSQMARLAYQLPGVGLPASGGRLEMLGDDPGLAGFYLVFDPGLEAVDGAAMTSRLAAHIVFPELPNGQDVEVTLVNPDETRAALALLRLRADGGSEAGAPVAVEIPARGRYSAAARALFGAAAAGGAYIEVESSLPLAAVEQFGIAGVMIAVLNGMDAEGGARELCAPQFVFGGGYRSTAALVNLEDAPTTVTLEWRDGRGALLGRTLQVDLPGHGRAVIADPASFGVAAGPEGTAGYLTAASAATRIAGSVRFGDPLGSRFQTCLPMVSEGTPEVLYAQAAQDDTWFTGLAVVNLGTQPARLVVEVYDGAGRRIGAGERRIDGRGRISEVLAEIVPGLPPASSGYFIARADRPLMSFAVFGPRSLQALAAVTATPEGAGR